VERNTPWVVRREWGIPYWSLALVAGAAALLAYRPIARQRRWIRSGHCGACGYDLRGSSSCCPECGRER